MDSETLIGKISEKHGKVRYGGGLSEIIASVKPEIANYDIIVTLGAGDVWKVADALVQI